MDITVTITLDDAQARAVQKQLAFAQLSQPKLTATALVTHLLNKQVANWVDEQQKAFLRLNEAPIKDIISTLAADPDRNAKIESLGYEFTPDGSLQKKIAADAKIESTP